MDATNAGKVLSVQNRFIKNARNVSHTKMGRTADSAHFMGICDVQQKIIFGVNNHTCM
jgi:hypothetical protein